jgi:hypothetical protein
LECDGLTPLSPLSLRIGFLVNVQSATRANGPGELDSAFCLGEPASEWRSPNDAPTHWNGDVSFAGSCACKGRVR